MSNNLDPIVEKIKTGMPFMGFRGLNEIFVAMSSNQDWIEIGTEISNKNYTSEVKEYLSRIPNQSLLVDTGWGDFSEPCKMLPLQSGAPKNPAESALGERPHK